MKNVVLLISLVVTLLPNIKADNYGENLLARLNDEIQRMNNLVAQIQEHYRGKQYRHFRVSSPRSSEITTRRGDDAKHSVSNERERNFGVATRRSNGQLTWEANFYKALSRALKNEYKDEPIIQENIHDGFVPPVRLEKRKQR